MKTCPNCKLINPDSATHCDCGFDLNADPSGPAARSGKPIYARPEDRAEALLIDVGIMGVFAIFPIMGRSEVIGPEAAAWEFWTWALVFSGPYFLIAQLSKWKCTVGKKVFRLSVCDLEGARIGFGRAIIRYALKLICSPLWFVSLYTICNTIRNQALHDLITGTIVLRDRAF